jgi:hypothetical protein
VRAARDLAARVHPLDRGLGVLVDDEAAVLVVEHGVREYPLAQRIDPARPVAPQHVRQRDIRVGLGNPCRVEVDRRTAVGRLDAVALLHLVDDRL